MTIIMGKKLDGGCYSWNMLRSMVGYGSTDIF